MQNIDTINLVLAIIGTVFGLFGTTLGLLTTWRLFDRDRVKLRVIGRHAMVTGANPMHTVSIDVLNLSTFPVTVTEVGFLAIGKQRLVILAPMTTDRVPIPRTVEPRNRFCVLLDPSELAKINPAIVTHVFAGTACGVQGKSSASGLLSG